MGVIVFAWTMFTLLMLLSLIGFYLGIKERDFGLIKPFFMALLATMFYGLLILVGMEFIL